ncbi:KH domain-containing protein [Granulicatella seriolae]|uniref:RNA-binding protein KhpA n=1 Tax=Granulicatella seriolae TaxID=2967226 RepID=A0ABT1WNT7_9LACT|nr:KH domain-containing protein [Granulicatella seriolae]
MPDISELVLTMVRPLVAHPEVVTIEISESDEFMEYTLIVHPEDVGRVIGKQGRVARAIRTIAYSVRTKGPKRVRISISNTEEN